MQNKTKKIISAFLTLAMMFGLFWAMTVPASAAGRGDASGPTLVITRFDHGGTATKKLTASVHEKGGDTVVVTGDVTGVMNPLTLNIPADVTVIWEASYSGDISAGDGMITLTGDGTFEVAEGGSIINEGDGYAISDTGAGTVVVSGGEVSSTGGGALYGNLVNISGGTITGKTFDGGWALIAGDTINISGGTITGTISDSNGLLISGNKVNLSGGTITATNGTALYAEYIEVKGAATVGNDVGSYPAIGVHGDLVITAAQGNLTVNGDVALYDNGVEQQLIGANFGTLTINGNLIFDGNSIGIFSNKGGKVYIAGELPTNAEIWVDEHECIDNPQGTDVTLPAPYDGYYWDEYTNPDETSPSSYVYHRKDAVEEPTEPGEEPTEPATEPTEPETEEPTEPPPTPPPFPFVDVLSTDWFYNNVKTAWEMGLVNGKTANTYEPTANLTYAEAVKLAACMHQYYKEGNVTLVIGTVNWYDTYVEYAMTNGII